LPTLDRRSTEEQQERNKETAGGKNKLAGGKAQAAERSQETKSLAPAKTTENQKSTGARSAAGSENQGGNTSKRLAPVWDQAPSKIELGRNPDASGDQRTWAREEGSALTRARAGKRNTHHRNHAANKMSDKTLRRCRPQEFQI
jgi:hypothetical protein